MTFSWKTFTKNRHIEKQLSNMLQVCNEYKMSDMMYRYKTQKPTKSLKSKPRNAQRPMKKQCQQ